MDVCYILPIKLDNTGRLVVYDCILFLQSTDNVVKDQ